MLFTVARPLLLLLLLLLLHFPGSLPGDVGEAVAVGGVGHQPNPWVVAALLEHLAQDDQLQLEHGDGLVHHSLQQHTVGQQNLGVGESYLSWQRRPTSRLILSPDFLLVGSFMWLFLRSVVERSGEVLGRL